MRDILGFSSPKSQWQSHQHDIQHAIHDVLASGQYIQGKYHEKFETEFANYLEVPHVVAVGSGTDALVIAIKGLGLKVGDEILVPTLTAPATISAVKQTGAVPRFVDVDQRAFTVKIKDLKNKINERTRAIIVVHLYGYASDVRKIKTLCDERNLRLIEDCAQSAGAKFDDSRVGSIGHVGCFSFFPTKNLGAIGDGGALSTHDAVLAEQFRRIRTYGWSEDRICIQDGINSRLDEMQAAILCVKLPHLDKDNYRRAAIARRYSEGLRGLPITLPYCKNYKNFSHVFHLFVITTKERDNLQSYLADRGVSCGIHYPLPCHLHPGLSVGHNGSLPIAETLSDQVLSLPIYPELSESNVDRVISLINEYFAVRCVE